MSSSYPPQAPENGTNFTSKIHKEPYDYIGHYKHVGHNVLITGGVIDINRAIALTFARAGASGIAMTNHTDDFGNMASDLLAVAKMCGHPYPQIVLKKVDVANEASVKRCASLLTEEFKGRLDILVNNACYGAPVATVDESDSAGWWRTFEVNLKGIFLMSKHFLPLLVAGLPAGQMVNINNVEAHNLQPMNSADGTSYLAALRLTEFLMVDAGDRGLLAYSVHPGAAYTDYNDFMENNPSDAAARKRLHDALKGCDGPAVLMGDTVAWLTSERRTWLAGRYISASWDMEELVGRKEEIVKKDKLKVRLVV